MGDTHSHRVSTLSLPTSISLAQQPIIHLSIEQHGMISKHTPVLAVTESGYSFKSTTVGMPSYKTPQTILHRHSAEFLTKKQTLVKIKHCGLRVGVDRKSNPCSSDVRSERSNASQEWCSSLPTSSIQRNCDCEVRLQDCFHELQ